MLPPSPGGPCCQSSPQRALSAGFSVSAPTQLSAAGENEITSQTCILYLRDHHPQFSRVQHRRTSRESLDRFVLSASFTPAQPLSHGLWTPGSPSRTSVRRSPCIPCIVIPPFVPDQSDSHAQAPWAIPSCDKKRAASLSTSWRPFIKILHVKASQESNPHTPVLARYPPALPPVLPSIIVTAKPGGHSVAS